MKKLILILLALATWAGATKDTIFCDANYGSAGSGTFAAPYKALASVNWTTIATDITNGDTVSVLLKSNSIFRETFTVGCSGGSDTRKIRIGSYSTGTRPKIYGSTALTGWATYSGGLGSTWRCAHSGTISQIGINDSLFYTSAGDSTNLADKHFKEYAGSRIYIRYDAGNPDVLGYTSESTKNNSSIICNYSYVEIDSLMFGYSNSSDISLAPAVSSSDILIQDCDFLNCALALTATNVDSLAIYRCTAKNKTTTTNGMFTFAGTTNSMMMFCKLEHYFDQATTGSGVYVSSTGTTNVYNTSIFGSFNIGIQQFAGTVNVNGCIIGGMGKYSSSSYTIQRTTAGTCNVKNSILIPNVRAYAALSTGTTDLGGNMYVDPCLKHQRKFGIYLYGQDDAEDAVSWYNMSRIADWYNIKTYLSLSKSDDRAIVSATLLDSLKTRVAAGHQIISHTRDHIDATELRAFKIKYVGGGSACSMTIDSATGLLTTTVTGASADNLSLNINKNKTGYLRMGDLVAYVNGLTGKYTCAQFGTYSDHVRPWLLHQISGDDIKNVIDTVHVDTVRFFAWEDSGSKHDIDSIFYPYVCQQLAYSNQAPNTQDKDTAFRYGYITARGISADVNWLIDSMDKMNIASTTSTNSSWALGLFFENNTNDAAYTGIGNFTNVGSAITFTTDPFNLYGPSQYYSGVYNGTTAYCTHADNALADYSHRSWEISVALKPGALTGNHTLYFQGTDANNFMKLYLSSDGKVNLQIHKNGFDSLLLSSGVSAVSIVNAWQLINVRERFNKYWIYKVNTSTFYDSIIATTTSNIFPDNYTGTIYIGCSYENFSNTQDFYNGKMADFNIFILTAGETASQLFGLQFYNGVSEWFTHGESGFPLEGWRLMFDESANYQGTGGVLNYTPSQFTSFIINSTTVAANNKTVTFKYPDSVDYRLKKISPANWMGDTTIVSGHLNMKDLNGTPITNASGHVLFKALSFGAYQYDSMSITVQPAGVTKGVGETNAFSVTASSNVSTYQWWKRLKAGSWGAIGAAIASSYTTGTLSSADDSSWYKVALGNSSDTIFSDSALLKISSLSSYTVTIANDPTHPGTISPTAGAHSIDSGTVTALSFTGPAGYRLSGWTSTGGVHFDADSTHFWLSSNGQITASDTIIHFLMTNSASNGTFTPSTGLQDSGAVFAIAATPAAHYAFTSWSVSGGAHVTSTTSATTTAWMTAAGTITANFHSIQYTLTMAASGPGTTTPSPGDVLLDTAVRQAIHGTPTSAWDTLAHWTGTTGVHFNPDSSACSLSASGTATCAFAMRVATTPTQTSPAQGDTLKSLTKVFTWSAQATTDSAFILGLSTDSATFTFDTVTTNSKNKTLSDSTKYFWKVKGGNPGGWSAYSTVLRFQTAASSAGGWWYRFTHWW